MNLDLATDSPQGIGRNNGRCQENRTPRDALTRTDAVWIGDQWTAYRPDGRNARDARDLRCRTRGGKERTRRGSPHHSHH